MDKNKEFKPYIPADKITPEFTVTSIIMGVILAVIFGAANAYLGLRVGMTVSASIPAAVISMGVIRKIMKKNSILESNMVQTIGSAGESLAAGAIFTMPALFLWAEEGLCEMPGIVEITLIALCGGVLGVLFMVPLRNALIVKEHATLLYPEGTACADVLLAGEEGGANAATVFSGMGIAAIFKFVVDGLKVIPADVAAAFKGFKGEIGMECYPALLGVGYIVGPRIASFMFVGSLIEMMKNPGRGTCGHIAIQTNYLARAMYHLEKRGFVFDESSFKYDAKGNITVAYLKDEIAGFAVHFNQK